MHNFQSQINYEGTVEKLKLVGKLQ